MEDTILQNKDTIKKNVKEKMWCDVKNLNRSTNIITTNTEYTIDPQSNIEETTLLL